MLISGNAIAHDIILQVKTAWQKHSNESRPPCLCVIQVGSDTASTIYIRNKMKACDDIGFVTRPIHFPDHVHESEILLTIDRLNLDDSVDGILVQLPLPTKLNRSVIIGAINPQKDVDAITPHHLGLLLHDAETILPCTAAATLAILDHYQVHPKGRNVVMVGASMIVGKPTAIALLNRGATVTICHIHTLDLEAEIRRADILITAIGKPDVIDSSWLHSDCVVIDVGINHASGKVVGDIDSASVEQRVNMITPVPGGVGPVTVACLLHNLYRCYQGMN